MHRRVVALFVSLAACGGGAGAPSEITTELEIEVRATAGGEPDGATLRCGDDVAQGTGFHADDAAAACEALDDEDARTLLIQGAPADRACAEIYGGPAIAAVRGVLDGEPVDVMIDRTNGCGISDWGILEPLIGTPPPWDPLE
jgi:hypothetical protein